MTMPAPCVIGIDVGTSSTKALLVDTAGEVLASAREEYPMHRPFTGWAENDPDDWVRAVVGVTKTLIQASNIPADTIKAICIVAQRDPIVLLDRTNRLLRPSISWIDQRDLQETASVYDRFGREPLFQTCGLVPLPGLALPVIHWIRRHDPDAWRLTHRILAAKDYILFRLTGRVATDTSTPSRSMLYDLKRQQWSEWICEKADIDLTLLPKIETDPWDVWGTLSVDMAERLGLSHNTLVAAGGGDDPSAALGAGAVEVGDVAIGTGTASCWRIITNSPTPDPQGHADLSPHLVSGRFVFELIITGTGTSLRWFKEAIGALPGEGGPYDRLLAEADEAPAGADGLMFFPYLEGARAPRFIDEASGVFFGLRAGHRRSHLLRAIIEGIAFQYPPVISLLGSYTPRTPGKLILVDDEAASPLWNQIKADVCGCPVQTLRTRYAASLGASILAAQAAGLFNSAREAVSSMVRQERLFEPNPSAHRFYQDARARYEAVFSHVANAYRDAANARSAMPEHSLVGSS